MASFLSWLSLPLELVIQVFQFLTIKDLAFLDTALCVHQDNTRNIFLEILSCEELAFALDPMFRAHSMLTGWLTTECLVWLNTKKFTVFSINYIFDDVRRVPNRDVDDDIHISILLALQFNPNLTFINFEGIKDVHDSLVDLIIFDLSEGKRLLHTLHINNCGDLRNRCVITDYSINKLCNNFSSFVKLSLCGCNITDQSIKLIAATQNHLEKFCISDTPVTDVGVKIIAKKMLKLKELLIAFCAHVTDNSVVKLAKLPVLETLNCEGVMISDKSLLALAAKSPPLFYLSFTLNYDDGMTDAVINRVKHAISEVCINHNGESDEDSELVDEFHGDDFKVYCPCGHCDDDNSENGYEYDYDDDWELRKNGL
jgi:hypothetical protein